MGKGKSGAEATPVASRRTPGSGRVGAELKTAIRTSEMERAKFTSLLELMPDCYIAVEKDRTISMVNSKAEELLGYTRDELIGTGASRLFPEADSLRHSGLLAAETVVLHKTGQPIPVEARRSALEFEGEHPILVTLRDMRPRLAAEEERAEAQRRAQVSRRLESLGNLAGGIAHDFNNILSIIVNYADFIAEEVSDNERAVKDAREIRKAGERAIDLVKRLMLFSKTETNEPDAQNLKRIIEEIKPLLRSSVGENIDVVFSLGDIEMTAVIDRSAFEQVLLNLIVNARDAIDGAGKISVVLDRTQVDRGQADRLGLAEGPCIALSVSDDGTGMPPEVAERVFEPFFSTKPMGEGTGLGLSIVHGIITQAGGALKVESEVGRGTTITAMLPSVDEDPGEIDDVPRADLTGDGHSILLVEDEDAVREVATRVLENNGYRVIAASRPSEALAYVSSPQTKVDLVLTDVVMPEMSGKDLADSIRTKMPGAKVTYMTGYSGNVITRESIGDAPFIHKPFTEQQLLVSVHDALSGATRSS